jgi:hypothetical protein
VTLVGAAPFAIFEKSLFFPEFCQVSNMCSISSTWN